MPQIPDRAPGPIVARVPTERAASARMAPQRVPTARVGALGTVVRAPPRSPAPAERPDYPSVERMRPRTGAAPHLVTPAQSNDFYDASFRELELIERDLVQRGPYAGAADRVQTIAAEAADLHAALGPSARSGDREFQAAQRRIEKVQAYLERVRPLLAGKRVLLTDVTAREPGLLGKLFGRSRKRH